MQEQMVKDAALFERVRHWREFRAGAPHLFPTDNALRWFIRQHETELVSAGVLLKLARGNYVDPTPFKALSMNIMRGQRPVDCLGRTTPVHSSGSPALDGSSFGSANAS